MENKKENENIVRTREIIVGSNDEIILSVPSQKGRTCININLDSEGLLVLSGGSDIVSRLVGEGWKEKIKEK